MLTSANRYLAGLLFSWTVVVGVPVMTWLSMFYFCVRLDVPWRAVAGGVVALLCMLRTAGTVIRIVSVADLFQGRALWRYFSVSALRIVPSYAVAAAVNMTCVWCWTWVAQWVAALTEAVVPDPMVRWAVSHGTAGIVTVIFTTIPVMGGAWIVEHHNQMTHGVPFGVPPMTRAS